MIKNIMINNSNVRRNCNNDNMTMNDKEYNDDK